MKARRARQRAGRGGTQALHTPAFLIDQNEKIVAFNRILDIGNEPRNAIGLRHIAGEQDQSCGFGVLEEGALVCGQRGPRHTGDQSGRHARYPCLPSKRQRPAMAAGRRKFSNGPSAQ